MMRMHSVLVCAFAGGLAFAFSCADSSTGDEGKGSGSAPPPSMTVCGDGTCAASEVGSCMQDCGSGGNGNQSQPLCGDGTCDATRGETAASCAVDCGTTGSGTGSGASTSCDPLLCLMCLVDQTLCVPPDDQASCSACLGAGSGSGSGGFGDDSACDGGAPDGTCSMAEQANPFTCITDCGQ